MKHLRLRIASLIIAIGLSLFVNSENNISSARVFVSIEVKDLPGNKVIVWQHRKQVEIEVRGPSFLVSRVVASPPTVRLELPEKVEGRYTAQISRRNLNIDYPLQVVGIEPSSVSFTVENKISREVSVRVPRIGTLDEEQKLEEIKLTPTHVFVTGPESEVGELQSVQSEPLDLREIKDQMTKELVLRVPGKLTEVVPNTVKAYITVSNSIFTKELSNLPVEIRSAPGKMFSVEPKQVKVIVSGTKRKIEALNLAQIIPYVRPTTNDQGKELAVGVDAPADITIVSIVPMKVSISEVRKGKK